jgi:hypothetical protein
MLVLQWVVALVASSCVASALHLGAFQSTYWLPHDTNRRFSNSKEQHRNLLNVATKATFVVALKHRSPAELKEELLAVSTPQNAKYGKHLAVDQIKSKYAPHEADAWSVVQFFESMEEATVQLNKLGTMMLVTAPIPAIEAYLSTSLSWHVHEEDLHKLQAASASRADSLPDDLQRVKRSLRATSAMAIPDHVAEHISFVSLNTPISHNVHPDMRQRASLKPKPTTPTSSTPTSSTPFAAEAETLESSNETPSETPNEPRRKTTSATPAEAEALRATNIRAMIAKMNRHEGANDADSADKRAPIGGPNGHVYVTEGNEEVLIRFFPRCADGQLNQMNPPCGAVVIKDRWTRRATGDGEASSASDSDSNSDSSSSDTTSAERGTKGNTKAGIDTESESETRAETRAGARRRTSQNHYSPPTPSPTPEPLPAPVFTAVVTQHASNKNDPYLLATEPLMFPLDPKVRCCAVLCCAVLCTELCYVILCCIVLYYSVCAYRGD